MFLASNEDGRCLVKDFFIVCDFLTFLTPLCKSQDCLQIPLKSWMSIQRCISFKSYFSADFWFDFILLVFFVEKCFFDVFYVLSYLILLGLSWLVPAKISSAIFLGYINQGRQNRDYFKGAYISSVFDQNNKQTIFPNVNQWHTQFFEPSFGLAFSFFLVSMEET